MAATGFHSRWKLYFKILLFAFLALFGVYAYARIMIFLTNKQLADTRVVVQEQDATLLKYHSLSGFNKLLAVKQLESSTTSMTWTNHIQKILDMLANLKNIDQVNGDSIVLSDFNVTLDRISVRGRVSNLLLLYYTSPTKGITSLIDRFLQLDFVEKMKIKNYTKAGDYFEFVLEANVVPDGK